MKNREKLQLGKVGQLRMSPTGKSTYVTILAANANLVTI